MTEMREKQILAGAVGIKKENWGKHASFRDKYEQLFEKAAKYKEMYYVFFQIEALLSLKNTWLWLPPIFFLDTKSTC